MQNAISLDAARRWGDKKDTGTANGTGNGNGAGNTDSKKDRCGKCGGNHKTSQQLEPAELKKNKERNENRGANRCLEYKKPGINAPMVKGKT